ncbi:MAG: hypothetical protein MI867_14135, partial [Pseudomonadales bacterium]|nr:hypothetical protein [Pseudomonadales bacterium]
MQSIGTRFFALATAAALIMLAVEPSESFVKPRNQPDLKGNQLRGGQVHTFFGNSLRIVARIVNRGRVKTGPFDVRFVLSRDQVGSADDIPLRMLDDGSTIFRHKGIRKNRYGPYFTLHFELPNTRPAGWVGNVFYVIMHTDVHNEVAEAREDNNFGESRQIKRDRLPLRFEESPTDLPVSKLPDLDALSFNITDKRGPFGTPIGVAMTVINTGRTRAGFSRVGFFLSADRKLSDTDIELFPSDGSSTIVPRLAPHQTIDLEYDVATPPFDQLPPRFINRLNRGKTVSLFLVVDADDAVAERSESNNIDTTRVAKFKE